MPSLLQWLRNDADRSFSWSFLGFFVGIFGVAFGVWAYFRPISPRLTYEILTNTPVLNVREDVNDLQVMFKGNDISKDGQSLIVVTFRVENNGAVGIKIGDYDPRSLLGLSIGEGEIVERPKVIAASTGYERDAVEIILPSDRKSEDEEAVLDNRMSFEPLILDPQEFFTIKLLALTSSEVLELQPVGKVAGVKNIRVVQSFEKKVESSNIWTELIIGIGATLLGYALVQSTTILAIARFRRGNEGEAATTGE